MLKSVTIGDGTVGKTCLLIQYVYEKFPDVYIPTSLYTVAKQVRFKDKDYELGLWDTAGGVRSLVSSSLKIIRP